MIRDFFRSKKQRSLLYSCLLASLCLHCFILFTLYNFPFLLSYPFGSLFKKNTEGFDQLAANEKSNFEKQKMIEESLQKITVSSGNFQRPFDYSQNPFQFAFSAVKENPVTTHFENSLLALQTLEIENTEPKQTQIAYSPSIELTEENVLGPAHSINNPKIDLFITEGKLETLIASAEQKSELGTNEFLSEIERVEPKALLETVEEKKFEKEIALATAIEMATEKNSTDSKVSIEYSQKQPLYFPRDTSEGPLLRRNFSADPSFNDLLASIQIKERSDFDVHIKIGQKEDQEGYLFSVTFQPKFALEKKAIKQHIYFIIDRSNSVEKYRYNTFKKGVQRALSVINPSDSFNIIVFDKKVVKLSEEDLTPTPKNLKLAEQFLEKQQHAGYFASADVYASLNKVLPTPKNDRDIFTAILLSNGETDLSASKQKTILSEWQKKNQGRVAVYSAAISNKNNLMLLDLLAKSNRGKLLYSDTHASFPRKLTKLVSTLSNPIARDLSATTSDTSDDVRIQLFSGKYHLPNLYYAEPFTVVGKINKLEDFTLLIEGRDRNDWFVIKQPIYLKDAVSNKSSLFKQYASEEAYLYYNKFLKDGDELFLQTAKKILREAGSEVVTP